MNKKRALLFQIGTIVILLAICALMMVIGRGHTVYLDNKPLEYEGKTYESPYKISIYVDGEQVAKLYEGERGQATNIGQNFEVTLKIMQTKGGEETTGTYQVKLPYSVDGVIINIPAFLGGAPAEAYTSEFVPAVVETADDAAEEVPGGDEFAMGDF